MKNLKRLPIAAAAILSMSVTAQAAPYAVCGGTAEAESISCRLQSICPKTENIDICSNIFSLLQLNEPCDIFLGAKGNADISCGGNSNGNTDENNNTNSNGGSSNGENSETTEKPSSNASSHAQQVVDLVNAERAKAGLSALETNTMVASAAQVRAKEIQTSFSHTRPDGTSCFTALKEAGASYSGAGENIAIGQKTPQEVVTAWMNSEGHRANILNEKFTHIGVGYDNNAWVQMFTY